MAASKPVEVRPVRVAWYQTKGLDEHTRQVKFAGVPAADVPKLVAAVKKLYPNLISY